MAQLNLQSYEVLNDLLLIQWNDSSEGFVPLKLLRDSCPCAHCAGETDVFGNVYKGPPKDMSTDSYILTGLQPIGHYAIRPFWKDGHHDGIYSFEFLKNLCEKVEQS